MSRARDSRPGAGRRIRRAYLLLRAGVALGIAAAFVPGANAAPLTGAGSIGLHATFDDLRLRERLRASGRLVQFGPNPNFLGLLVVRPTVGASAAAVGSGLDSDLGGDLLAESPFETAPAPLPETSHAGTDHTPAPPDSVKPAGALAGSATLAPGQSPTIARARPRRPATPIDWSPDLETVFVIRGPSYEPAAPEFYLADGVYPVYDAPTYDDPTLRVRAVPRQQFETHRLAEARRDLVLDRQRASRGEGSEGGLSQGIQITVPFKMTGALAEVFGRGATNIKVSGRENLSFAGESRRVKPFIAGEQGRGQSLFPRLDMKQDLQVKLEGTIGDKVHVQVDHNSSGFGQDANRINIYYQGYDDDIVQRVDLGGTSLALPGASLVSFSGGHKGLFGIKSEMRLGGFKVNLVASKEEAQTETRSLTSAGGTTRSIVLRDDGYVRDKFFFYERPDTASANFYSSYSFSVTQLLKDTQAVNFRVFVDTQNPNTVIERPYQGFAVADLPANITPDQMTGLWQSADGGARWPKDSQDGRWRELRHDEAENEIGFVLFSEGANKYVLGFFLRNGTANPTDAIAIAIDDPNDKVGDVDTSARVRLRLIRHPDQNTDFATHPSAAYMMRHVYQLGAQDLTTLELRISRADNSLTPQVPLRIPNSTYLHMFGLDDLSDNAVGPDGKVDLNAPNLIDIREGLLFMPGVRPFDPPQEIIRSRLLAIPAIDRVLAENDPDSLFPAEERVRSPLYTLPPNDPAIPHRYNMEGESKGTDTDIILPQDVIEGSEVVKLGGRVLQKGTDYDIEYFAGGRITLKGAALNELGPSTGIEVSYQFRPLFGGGKSTLMGVSGEYELGTRGRLGSVFLYESTGSPTKRVKLGEEPTRSVVADVNGSLRFDPVWLTRLVNKLPFTQAAAPSQLNLSAEVAASIPNPNTRSVAYVDDLESADESDEQTTSRNGWSYASLPLDSLGTTGARSDTKLRVPVAYYNPQGEVLRGYLNPTLSENERKDGLPVLELGFDQVMLDSLLARPDRANLWSGIMRSFGTAGLDLTRTKSIEFWLNDYVGNPADRHGKMHIDFGDLSEDFIFLERQDALPFDSRFNFESPPDRRFEAANDDKGWDGVAANCPNAGDYPNDCETRQRNYPFGLECYAPEVTNCPPDTVAATRRPGNHVGGQHYLANGSEKNNQLDTEDLNNNGRFDTGNSYFGVTIDLADPTFVLTDVNPLYGGPTSPYPANLRNNFYGWRKYRIDLEKVAKAVLRDPSAAAPNLRKISYLRIWFEDEPGTPINQSLFRSDIQIYGMRFNRNQWTDLGFFGVDSIQVAPEPQELFSLGVINNKDDGAIYNLPPDATEIDEQGVQSREQALRINYTQLQAGHEVVGERILSGLGRGLDFTQYRRLNYFVKAAPGVQDTVEFFFRCGTDTLNYYEVAHRVIPGRDWLELNVDLTQLTDLKFPEDVPGSTFRTILHGAVRTPQVSAPTLDARDGVTPLYVTVRGQPSFTSITRFYAGVRNRATAFPVHGGEPRGGPRGSAFTAPVSGEVWFNNVRLEDPERTVGVAQSYNGAARFSDVFDVTANFSSTDADFRSLQQRTGSNQDFMRFQGTLRTEVSRLVPTLGFVIPISYNQSRDRTLPKFFTGSDTRNTEERKRDQRSESVTWGYGYSISKRPSRFWLSKVTLDRLGFSYSKAHDQRRTFTSRDTSESSSRSLKYDLTPKERSFGLFRKLRFNWMPSNFGGSIQEQRASAIRFNVFRPRIGTVVKDSLVQQASAPTRSLNVNAATAMRPLPILNLRYSFNESRDYRDAAPINEAERLTLLGYDLGVPRGRGESFAADLTPRLFRIGYSAQFSDQRTMQRLNTGEPLPDIHTASLSRGARLSFDFGLHRRIIRWIMPRAETRGSQGQGDRREDQPPDFQGEQPPDQPPGNRPPDSPPDQPDQPDRPKDFAPEAQAPGDTTVPDVPPVPPAAGAPPDSALAEPPAPVDSLAPQPPVPQPPVPPPGVPGASDTLSTRGPAPADSAAARPKGPRPNPLLIALSLVRKIGDIDAVKVEYTNTRTSGYTGLSDTPSGPFRYGFSNASGLIGAQFAAPQDQRDVQTLDLQTGIPIRSFRIGVKFKLDTGLRQVRNWDAVQQDVLNSITEEHTTNTTFPSLDLAINNVERIRLFSKRLERSNITLSYARATTDRFNTTQVPGGPETEGTSRNESTRDTFTGNWAGQWKRGVTTSLNFTQNGNTSVTSRTIKRTNTTRGLQGTMRFKVAPKGGLKLPFFGSRGVLKSGMDVSFTGSYNTELSKAFNNPETPDQFVLDSKTSAMQFGARSDYTLSRNMTGGFELGYTRQHNDVANQTINVMRLGFNITFMF